MDKYTASNGAQIVLTNARQTGYVLVEKDDDVASAYLGFEEMVAWREFFRAERDEGLGRWRWPANPDYVVYPRRDGAVLVLNEMSANGGVPYRRGDRIDDMEAEAACAYFEAHPVRQPWDGAAVGEIWAVTIHGEEKPCRVISPLYANDVPIAFLPVNVVSPTWFKPSASITAARRIWPESD